MTMHLRLRSPRSTRSGRERSPHRAPAKTTAPWLAAQRRGGFATGFATEAPPARPGRHETPSKQAKTKRKHRGIEEEAASRELSRNDANSGVSREGDGQETTQGGRFATGFATDRSKTPGAGEGLPEGLVEALRRLDQEVERAGDERLREVMREVWRTTIDCKARSSV